MTATRIKSLSIRELVAAGGVGVNLEIDCQDFLQALQITSTIQRFVAQGDGQLDLPLDNSEPDTVLQEVASKIVEATMPAPEPDPIRSDAHTELVESLMPDTPEEAQKMVEGPGDTTAAVAERLETMAELVTEAKAKRKRGRPRKKEAVPVATPEEGEAELAAVKEQLDQEVAEVNAEDTKTDPERDQIVEKLAAMDKTRKVLLEVKDIYSPGNLDEFVEKCWGLREEVPALARIVEDEFEARIRKTATILRICA